MNLWPMRKPDFRSLRSRTANLAGFAREGGRNLAVFARTRMFALSLAVCISMIVIACVAANTKIVQVSDGSGSKYLYTFRSNPVSILKQYGVTLAPEDQYDFTPFQNNFAKINLYLAFPVSITADKSTRNVLIAKGTVRDALTKAGVSLGSDDLINCSPDSTVLPNQSIVVRRVTYQTVVQSQPIDYKVNTQSTTLLKKGAQQVLVSGQAGQMDTTLKIRYIDGQSDSQEVVSQSIVSQPVDSTVLVGTAANTPVSQLQPPSSLTLTSRGSPDRYSQVIDTLATGYSPSDGTRTATGRTAKVGYVAVNPNVIPYGSRLYIMSDDGSFVYGYAIAYDTGGFISNGSGVGVDLYFSSAAEASRFGKRHVKIYVLS